MIEAIIGTVAGALITFLAAHLYYVRASADLTNEANQLRNLNHLILRAMEDAGIAEFSRDANGNIVGMRYNIKAHTEVTIKPSSTTHYRSADAQRDISQ